MFLLGLLIGLLSIFFLVVLMLMGIYFYYSNLEQYVTTDLKDYGHYTGNYNNEWVEDFINAIFPLEISECFSDVKYSYRAEKGDTFAFEAYLEVEIKEYDVYEEVLESYIGDAKGTEFVYDSSYNEVVYYDYFEVRNESKEADNGDYHIGEAYIGKILYCEEEQKIIFVALGVYDGGWTTTDFLNVYFQRFNIDPFEYAGSHSDRNGRGNPLTKT